MRRGKRMWMRMRKRAIHSKEEILTKVDRSRTFMVHGVVELESDLVTVG